jgi:hypothetical protein
MNLDICVFDQFEFRLIRSQSFIPFVYTCSLKFRIMRPIMEDFLTTQKQVTRKQRCQIMLLPCHYAVISSISLRPPSKADCHNNIFPLLYFTLNSSPCPKGKAISQRNPVRRNFVLYCLFSYLCTPLKSIWKARIKSYDECSKTSRMNHSFSPLVFNFYICGFEIYGTLIARINRLYRGLPVVRWKSVDVS